ncbi:hypothetical protein O1R50_00390 [Glycomyces luteolus]|uniref:Uncharacterized protein n=1 Tax=Glycomyces luteolus TaxID=2670330 RepID=A0A9X3SNC6_9ACTN|nr:hypothetical protein [Glycomyces luteolus]MDA1358062.1 hypothetical protein [Glycomyces luteolus]
MLLADPAPGPVRLGPAEAVHADTERPAADRAPVEVGVETRNGDRLEVDVRQGLVIREIGEMRDLADFLQISHGHTWSNDRACPWLRYESALRPVRLQLPFRFSQLLWKAGGPNPTDDTAVGVPVGYTPKNTSASA